MPEPVEHAQRILGLLVAAITPDEIRGEAPLLPRLNRYKPVGSAESVHYCGKVIGEYLEKLVDRGHPRDRVLKPITYLMGAFVGVDVTSKAAPVRPTDPDDEVLLLCALDGGAEYLVSEDRALLELKAAYLRPVIGRSSELAPGLGAKRRSASTGPSASAPTCRPGFRTCQSSTNSTAHGVRR